MMTKPIKNKPSPKLIFWIILIIGFFIFVTVTVQMFVVKDTGTSYSLTQSWKEYYGLEDWNLSKHGITDIDGDGKKDLITFTGCVFLSSIVETEIPLDKQCQEPWISTVVFPDHSINTGQNLISTKPFHYQGLRKSFLVKTINDTWKYYDMNGLQIRTFELEENGIFNETKPTLLDKVDTLTYQVSHLGVILLLKKLLI